MSIAFWNGLALFLNGLAYIAIATLVVSALVVGLMVATYVLEEFKVARKTFRDWRKSRKIVKESQDDWEQFFFDDTLPRSFHNTGEIIKPEDVIGKKEARSDDLGHNKKSK